MTQEVEIFLDMDEVVADFTGYAHTVLRGERLTNGYTFPPEQWARLKDNPRMYRDLPLKEGATELVQWCKDYQDKTNCGLYFLTAMPRNNDMPWAFQDKVFWALDHFPSVPVFFGPRSSEKVDRCKGANSILIDDRKDNCKQWIAAGGRAHQYKNWEECKVWLENELKD